MAGFSEVPQLEEENYKVTVTIKYCTSKEAGAMVKIKAANTSSL